MLLDVLIDVRTNYSKVHSVQESQNQLGHFPKRNNTILDMLEQIILRYIQFKNHKTNWDTFLNDHLRHLPLTMNQNPI